MVITVDWDDFHTADLGCGWVGSVSGGWAKADVSLEVSSALVILLDGHETSVLTCSTTVWLRGDAVVLCNAYEVFLNLMNQSLETLALVKRSEWMKIGETVESYWNHANSGVKLHGARTESDHRIGQTHVLVGKSLNVSHHVSLGELHVELILLQEFSFSSNFFWRLLVDFAMILLEIKFTFFGVVLVLLQRIKDINELVQVIKTGNLIEGKGNVVAINFSNVNSKFVELGLEVIWRGEARLFNLDSDCVKIVFPIGGELNANNLEFLHKDLRHESSFDGHLSKTVASVPLHVEGCHVGKESLSSADVAGSLISSNVLFSSL